MEATKEVWLETLIVDTPQEGRDLAIKMARKSIAAIQTDPETRKKLRPAYATDTAQLMTPLRLSLRNSKPSRPRTTTGRNKKMSCRRQEVLTDHPPIMARTFPGPSGN